MQRPIRKGRGPIYVVTGSDFCGGVKNLSFGGILEPPGIKHGHDKSRTRVSVKPFQFAGTHVDANSSQLAHPRKFPERSMAQRTDHSSSSRPWPLRFCFLLILPFANLIAQSQRCSEAPLLYSCIAAGIGFPSALVVLTACFFVALS